MHAIIFIKSVGGNKQTKMTSQSVPLGALIGTLTGMPCMHVRCRRTADLIRVSTAHDYEHNTPYLAPQ